MSKTVKDQARKLVEGFAKRRSPTAFPAISRLNVASDLRKRIDTPLMINQGRAGLCAPASLLASVAQSRPVEYVNYIIDLYEKGSAKIGKWSVKPGDDLKKYVPRLGAQISEADWIGMASMRDSENIFFDYQEVKDPGGTRLSEIESWSKKIGYTQVVSKTLRSGDTSKIKAENLREAVGLRSRGYKVILQIDANLLLGRRAAPTINHAVVLTSPVRTVKIGGKETVGFSVFSWGHGRSSIPPRAAGTLPIDFVLDRYGGFVAMRF